MPLVTLGAKVADVSTGVAIFGAITDDRLVAIAAASVSIGAILVPRLIDWYRAVSVARRAEHEADVELDSKILAREVTRRVELEVLVRDSKARIANLELDLAKLRGTVRTMTPDPDTAEHDVKPS